jgi:hypothetical protein
MIWARKELGGERLGETSQKGAKSAARAVSKSMGFEHYAV